MQMLAYYDSCVFFNAFNKTHAEYKSCEYVTKAENIRWSVTFSSELICSESPAKELLTAFEVACASAGIIVLDIPVADGRALAKKNVPLKQSLELLQVKGRDFAHLMCAVSAKSEVLLTVDLDFWDARNKANPGSRTKKSEAKKLIEKAFKIQISLPSEHIASLGP